MCLWLVQLCFASLVVHSASREEGLAAAAGVARGAEQPVSCSKCGSYLFDARDIIYVKSPQEIKVEQRHLFGRQNVTVVTIGLYEDVDILTTTSKCVPKFTPPSPSYFPGYNERRCYCPQCYKWLGWTYEHREDSPADQHAAHVQHFHALRLDYLAGPAVVGTVVGWWFSLVALAALLGGSALLVLACKRTQRAIKIHQHRQRNKQLREKHFLYDGFLAFSYHDADFADTVVSTLERYGLRLCVHWRDWPAGCWLPHAMQHAVQHSHRTVALLSPAFARGQWTRVELRMATVRHTAELGRRPVVILLEDSIPHGLRKHARAAHRLRHDDQKLWEKLRALLTPPPPSPRCSRSVA